MAQKMEDDDDVISPLEETKCFPQKRRSRRKSSLMYEYYRDNYMNLSEITEEHIQKMKECFALMDRDGDGKLGREELETVLRFTGMLVSDDVLNGMLETVDKNHNGSIDYDEFEKFVVENKVLEMLPDETAQEMKAAFDVFDKDGDGYIDRDELKIVLTQLGDKMTDDAADEFLRLADTNNDGRIDFIEFCNHMGY